MEHELITVIKLKRNTFVSVSSQALLESEIKRNWNETETSSQPSVQSFCILIDATVTNANDSAVSANQGAGLR
jgi:hypothetical protein